MAQLYDTNGNFCGNLGDEQAVPAGGYFTRPDNALTEMTSLLFFEKLGQTKFNQIWTSAKNNNTIAYELFKLAASQTVQANESIKAVIRLEKAGIVAVGTAIAIWA